ncbi:MAG: hypothetical protein ACLQLH_03450 [Terracidiphilus sp.]
MISQICAPKHRACVWALVILLLPLAAACKTNQLAASQAKNHIGEQATVCGVVASEHTAVRSRGVPTFINLDAAYPNEIFTVLVWGDDRRNVGTLPRIGEHVCATGMITEYRGVAQVVVRNSGQMGR